jgi:hypothetical protein
MVVTVCAVPPPLVLGRGPSLPLRRTDVALLCRGSASRFAGIWLTKLPYLVVLPPAHRCLLAWLLLPWLCFQRSTWAPQRSDRQVALPPTPYTMKNGVFPCRARLGWVRKLQATYGSILIHFPASFSLLSNTFFLGASSIIPLALSTCPLALGCATDAYLIWMLLCSQKLKNSELVKLDPRSVMMLLGIPNLNIIS